MDDNVTPLFKKTKSVADNLRELADDMDEFPEIHHYLIVITAAKDLSKMDWQLGNSPSFAILLAMLEGCKFEVNDAISYAT